MSLIRWSPQWDPFREMEAMMNRLPSLRNMQGMQNAFIPAVDVYETKEAVVVEMPLAGIDPAQVEVQVEKGLMTIEGESKKEREVEEKNYYRRETHSGSFYRQVPLPVAVKEDQVEAIFEDGMLKVTCPKATPTPTKRVSVKVKKA